MSFQIPLYNEKLQKTGYIDSDGMVLRKYISDPQNHQLLFPPAWAVDTAHLDILEGFGGNMIELTFRGGGSLQAHVKLFRHHGTEIDHGHGLQTALPLRLWSAYDSLSELYKESRRMNRDYKNTFQR